MGCSQSSQSSPVSENKHAKAEPAQDTAAKVVEPNGQVAERELTGLPKPVEQDTKPVVPADSKAAEETAGAYTAQQDENPSTEPELTPNRLKTVQDLFTEWDFTNSGKLELDVFCNVQSNLGSHKDALLVQMKQMDSDHDGHITKGEWTSWFASVGSMLTDEEFDTILDEIRKAGEPVVVIQRALMITSEPLKQGEDSDDDDAPQPLPSLPSARKEKVLELFRTWDFEEKGMIDRKQVEAHGMKVGPHESQLFLNLNQMDSNNDNVITEEEMLFYFQVISPNLSDDEFHEIISQMLELAQDAASIRSTVQMLAEMPGYAVDVSEDEAPKVGLDDETREKLEALWLVMSPSVGQPIKISDLQRNCKIKMGPHESDMFASLVGMDSDQDGLLTFEEMFRYFDGIATTPNPPSKEDLDIVIKEMTDVASSLKLAALFAQ
eukprot:CAMPEP_0119324658 /NCGR_PEP_ID=MMETSP1333-20130426/63857_1 /TAXON_ID=418940 /ORGANISM="Scyphosphaera apsteinii, Strain RCC1455" /LENGTH=435 /DNA_ID=CAMNT_0007332429 /DNA_START=21 /DNA_END=1328 /DNA_ORIENTATION=-